jgi:hypothetical protein
MINTVPVAPDTRLELEVEVERLMLATYAVSALSWKL